MFFLQKPSSSPKKTLLMREIDKLCDNHQRHEVRFRRNSIVTITTLQNKRKTMNILQRHIQKHAYRGVRIQCHTHTSTLNDHKSNMLELHT